MQAERSMKHESNGWSGGALILLLVAGVCLAAIEAGVRVGTANVRSAALARAGVPADSRPTTPGPTDPNGPPG
jgi:hypothetical protein